MPEIPDGRAMIALSIRQPWSWLIVSGRKDVENRDWRTSFRGPVLIHAGKVMDKDCHGFLIGGHHPVTGETWCGKHGAPYQLGGIVGMAEIVDCVERSDSPWFVGRYGFILRNARPVDFFPCKGQLGLFGVDCPPGMTARLR
jgi:hypothetical protein